MNDKPVIIACSIFKNELEHLLSIGKLDFQIFYLDSMLHMQPKKLEKLLDLEISKHSDTKIILLFGDCHARIIDQQSKNICKVRGANCCDTFMGKERYQKIRKDRSFVLLNEWTTRWREVFQEELGFKSKKLAQKFMGEMHKNLIFVDTGIVEIPQNLLDEISDFTGLPYNVEKCNLDELKTAIKNANIKLTT